MKKVSFRVRSFDKEQFLTYNIDNEACLDEEVLDFIEDEEPKGIVSVIFEEGEEFDTFSYDITDRIHISELANQEINAEMVLKVLHSLVLTLIDMAEYRIPLSYLVLHRDYVYVDSDYRIKFICIPLEEMQEDVDVNAFLRSYLANIRYDLSEDCSYVAKLITYVNNTAIFNLHNMITLIEEVMEDMGIEIPEEASAEIYVDYQEVMEEAEELEDADELSEEEVLEEDVSEETKADTDTKEESAFKLASAPEEEEAEKESPFKLASIPEEEEDEAEKGIGDLEQEASDADETDESEGSKSVKNSPFSLKEPEPDEEELSVEEAEESFVEEEVEEQPPVEEEIEEQPLAEEEIGEPNPVEELEEEVSLEEEIEQPLDDMDEEAIDIAEDLEEAEEPQESENDEEKESKQRRPIFKTKDTAVTGVVIEDDFDEFLAEKERQEQLEHQEESGLKIKKNIKVNRASLVKNTQDEKSENPEEDNDTKADEGGEEEEQTANTSILGQTLGAAGILKGATPPKVNPYLIRTNTKERIMITKQNFKLGKASMGVDYTIKGNGAVSRTHAIITNKDGVYYIKDNKSTNHTYVNNKMVADGENAELKHDCKIVLGDEEFTFKMQ